ncbi:branched-chain amino acid transport system substrate-binding protein [Rhodoligotrophos appendicifer]|uniref:ABC transporter substrate-binding protein n=1 Tax=Rhodoligotrophos appendicifer TaxID=987056 RepID=UPI00118600BB|nr:ABC transporter substrate-binding protein [Rhodoligotrophos appendicifer]
MRPAFKHVVLALGFLAATVPALADDGPIKIGIISSITGPAANTGQQELDGAQLAIDMANKAGGINGRQLQGVVYDDKYDPATAAVGMTTLVNSDNVVAVAGSTSSASVLALAPIAARLKVADVSFAALTGKFTKEPPAWIFGMYPPAPIESAAILKYLLSQKDIKKVAIIHDSVPYATTLRDQFMAAAKEAGLEIIAVESYQPHDTDFQPQLIKIQSAKPDVIVQFGGSIPPAIIAKTRYQLGIKTPMVAGSPVFGVGLKKFKEIGGDAAVEGLVASLSTLDVYKTLPASDPRTPAIQTFATAFKEKYGREPVNYNGLGYDAVNLIIDAIKRAGTDREKIRDALEATQNFAGTTAVVSFSPTNHIGPTPESLVMAQVKDGALVALP